MNRVRPTNSQGYVLMVVAVTLVVIATLSLTLFANTNASSQQLDTRYELQQLQYTLDAGVAHAKANLLSNTSCASYSSVSGSLPGATYTSSLSANSGSPITATVTATHSSGLQRTSSIELNAYTTSASVNLFASEDTHVKEDKPDNNESTKDKMHSQAEDNGKDEHMLLVFDLTGIPTPSMVVSADLEMELHSSNEDNDPDKIYRIARSWLGDETTWSKYQTGFFSFWLEPGGQHQYHVWGSFPDSIVGTKLADVTGLVRLWHGGLPNYGMLLRSEFDANNSHKHYWSIDAGDTNDHPRLLVDYRCECGTAC